MLNINNNPENNNKYIINYNVLHKTKKEKNTRIIEIIENNKNNKKKVIKEYNYLIKDLWLKELYWKLWNFYEKMWDYINAKKYYETHIAQNNDYKYYKKLWYLLEIYWKKIIPINQTNLQNNIIDIYKKLLSNAELNNDSKNIIYANKKLWYIYEKRKNINNALYYYEKLYHLWEKIWDKKLIEIFLIKKLYLLDNNDKEEIRLITTIWNLDNKHIIIVASYYENKWDIKNALNLYYLSYTRRIEWSNEAFWFFIETIAIQTNNNYLKEISEKIYNYKELSINEINIIDGYIFP